jgi:TolB-like protein
MADIIYEIKNRRILPAVGVYAGGCWVLIEILDRLVERYLLSPYITDIAFWGLYSLIPAVILVAWSHGRPGKDKSTTLEKVGVPINIIATLGLLLTAFGGKELGATANMITVANEEGVQETHYVPSESFRRRMAVFFFENASGDPELDWLQYGITELLVQDLQQNPFVLATSPWNNFGNGFYRRMRQAGFEDGLGVPRSLMREIALDANRQHFLEGSIDRDGQEYRLTVRIWDTQTLQQVDELTESGWDLYAGSRNRHSKATSTGSTSGCSTMTSPLPMPISTRPSPRTMASSWPGSSRPSTRSTPATCQPRRKPYRKRRRSITACR